MTSLSYPSIKSFYIENLGCAKNQVDAEVLIEALLEEGLSFSREDPDAADMIIVNTCAFIGPAKEESVNTLLSFRKLYPGKIIVAAGCFSQRYGSELASMMPEVDGIFGNKDLTAVGDLLKQIRQKKDNSPVLYLPDQDGGLLQRQVLLSRKGTSYVKIAEGCRNRCRYCAIPLIRGDVLSRSKEAVLGEISDLAGKGIKEMNLVAQDLAHFGLDRGSAALPDLLGGIKTIPGDFWIRLLYIHPDHFPLEILDMMDKDPRILPYFDIPFQHASPEVLSRMGRKGNPEVYLKLLDDIRSRQPNAVFRSTFLTGFAGETDKDVDILLDFQKRAELDWLGVFTYSPEEGTPAFKDKKVPRKKAALQRKERIEAIQLEITPRRLQRFLGRTLPVFIEEPVEGENLYLGRFYGQAPEVDGLVVVHGTGLSEGTLVEAKILRVNGVDLEAVAL